jgi:hypothetical protein
LESTNHQSGLGRLGRGAAGRVQVITYGPLPFAVGSLVWRDARGALVCTVIAKASYELAPGQCSMLKDPVPLQEADAHWDNAPTNSVRIPSDLAPFKSAPEVVVVGSAFAPAERPLQSVTARLVVGSVDKPVEVWAPRQFRRDGAIEGASRLARFSLRYEHAAGGPETDNPVGLDVTRTDAWGRVPIPQLLPPFFELKRPGDYIPIAGLGPFASTWPPRALHLREQDRAWLHRPSEAPLPPGFSAKFFQVAPPDQWLDRPLAANERLILEGLHAEVPRLVTNLPGIEPWVIVVDSRSEPLRLQGDLLVIETDQALATLTFRGQFAMDEGSSNLTVVVVGTPLGTAPTMDTVRSFLDHDTKDGFRLTGSGSPGAPEPHTDADLVIEEVEASVHEMTSTDDPFGDVTNVSQAPSPSRNALPFKPAAPPRIAPGAPPLASSPAPSPVGPPPLSPPPVAPALVAPAPVAPLPVVAPPAGVPSLGAPTTSLAPMTPAPVPWNAEPAREPARAGHISLPSLSSIPHPDPVPPGTTARDLSSPLSPRDAPSTTHRAGDTPKGFESAFGGAKASTDASAKSFDAAFGGAKSGSGASTKSFDATFGSARAASDAAAKKEASHERAPRDASNRAEKQPPRRLAVVDLLFFDAKIAPRLRAMPRFADVWTLPSKPRVQGVDAARTADEPDRDRMSVLRVLSCGRAADPSEVRGALADSLEDVTDFDLPLVLVAGELRPSFDEVETLRATVAAAQLVAKSDKKLVPTLTLAQEALAGPAPRPETALGLTRQIEQAAATLSLPPRYITTQVERVLLEERKFKRRTLLGSPRVRAELTIAGSSDVFLIYLPDAPSASLPLLPAWPALALCEVRPREDIAETHSEALVAVAFGRVLHSRYESLSG